jgi:hypothetical protein
MLKSIKAVFITLFVLIGSYSYALNGKVDSGIAWLNIDVLESGKTKETLNMIAWKTDATIAPFGGLCVKGGFLLGAGRHSHLSSLTAGIGHYFSIFDRICLLPNVGVTFSHLHTKIDFPILGLFNLNEKFSSFSPYVGLDVSVKLTEKWYLHGLFQYAWSRTHTTIGNLVSDHSHSDGPNYALQIEYCLNNSLSLNFGVGYNITLSKEKHGLRGKGAKLGLAYYY